jgi:type III secretion protein S
MDASNVTALLTQALYLTLLLSMPAIAVAAIVGTLFALFQALTQIQEQTLSFAVKLIAVCVVLYLTASWMGGELVNYTTAVFANFYRI